MKRIGLIFLLILAMIGLNSCAHIQQRMAIKNCQFDLVNVRAHNFKVLNLMMDLEIQIVNPNSIRVVVDQLDLLLFINHKRTLTAGFGGAVIEPGESQILHTRVRIPYLRVGIALVDIIKNQQEVTYRLDGHVYLKSAWGTFRFPVNIYKSY